MDNIFDNVYIVALKNKHFLPTAVLLLIGLITKKEKLADHKDNANYLGDNVPLDLVDRIKNA